MSDQLDRKVRHQYNKIVDRINNDDLPMNNKKELIKVIKQLQSKCNTLVLTTNTIEVVQQNNVRKGLCVGYLIDALSYDRSVHTLKVYGKFKFLETIQGLLNGLKQNQTIRVLGFENVNFRSEEIAKLSQLVNQNRIIHTLVLKNIDIKVKDIQILFQGLSQNKTIRVLNFSCSQLTNEGAKYLGETIKKNKSIEVLNINKTNIGYKGISFILNSIMGNNPIHTLDISENQIGKMGAQPLCEMLNRTSSICVLGLSWETLLPRYNQGKYNLVETLKQNRRIHTLKFFGKDFQKKEVDNLCNILNHNSTLHTLYLSWVESKNVTYLGEIMRQQNSIHTLYLSTEHFKPQWMKDFKNDLNKNKRIQSLGISCDEMKTEILKHLLDLANKNNEIKKLNLFYKRIKSQDKGYEVKIQNILSKKQNFREVISQFRSCIEEDVEHFIRDNKGSNFTDVGDLKNRFYFRSMTNEIFHAARSRIRNNAKDVPFAEPNQFKNELLKLKKEARNIKNQYIELHKDSGGNTNKPSRSINELVLKGNTLIYEYEQFIEEELSKEENIIEEGLFEHVEESIKSLHKEKQAVQKLFEKKQKKIFDEFDREIYKCQKLLKSMDSAFDLQREDKNINLVYEMESELNNALMRLRNVKSNILFLKESNSLLMEDQYSDASEIEELNKKLDYEKRTFEDVNEEIKTKIRESFDFIEKCQLYQYFSMFQNISTKHSIIYESFKQSENS